MTDSVIYLDYNATTPVEEVVLESMLPWFSARFWNAASGHAPGRMASEAVEAARGEVSELVGARPREIVWTSGATEADNLALKGVMESAALGRRRLLVGATEHKAVLDTAAWLESRGYGVDLLPVDGQGIVHPATLKAALGDDVALVSVMMANNETGAIAPLGELVEVAHECGALFHTDATQAVGRVPVNLHATRVDLASFSSHKMYGPKGVGALYVARGTQILPLIHGGGHEGGLRSGTLNVPAIVGFGTAASCAAEVIDSELVRSKALVDQLRDGLSAALTGLTELAADVERLPNTINLRFHGADAEAVMANARRVAISSGSACTALVPSASHVLRAMGLDEEEASECLRFSVGRPTSEDDIGLAIEDLAAAVSRVRELTC